MKLRTKAKVNLFLRILGKRNDGYHEVETILHSVDLADDLVLRANESGEISVTMEAGDGTVGEMPRMVDNFVTHAARALLPVVAPHQGLSLHITKRIPIAAGLGGGSGNAAGALVALNEYWELGLDRSALIAAGAKLGSDTPYCIQGGTALASGRGESLTHLTNGLELWVVLGISHSRLHTGDVYRAWDELQPTSEAKSAPMILAIGASDVEGVGALLHNDLEDAAFALKPELVAKKQAMLDAGAAGALLSGSGPTIFGIARDEAAARAVAARVQGEFDRVEVVHSAAECVEMLNVVLP
ncbi:MAG: 4-(cytidine 5'-diphospho)-2-C-methyl-D-erythritol kinase [Actinomycetota bacterium]